MTIEESVAGSWRTVVCVNGLCPLPRTELTVRPEAYGPFLRWPVLQCVCGAEPKIVDWATPYGRQVSLT